MRILSMFEDVKASIQVLQPAADNASYNGATLDMAGFEGVMFIAAVEQGEAIACSIKAQSGADSGLSDAADLAGTSVDVSPGASADGFGVLDLKNPQERYVRCVATAGNFTTPRDFTVIAIQYGARRDQTNTGEFHSAPAEGTA